MQLERKTSWDLHGRKFSNRQRKVGVIEEECNHGNENSNKRAFVSSATELSEQQ